MTDTSVSSGRGKSTSAPGVYAATMRIGAHHVERTERVQAVMLSGVAISASGVKRQAAASAATASANRAILPQAGAAFFFGLLMQDAREGAAAQRLAGAGAFAEHLADRGDDLLEDLAELLG